MDDLISRQEAIVAVLYAKDYLDAERLIKALPSAQRKGKWIYLSGVDAFECSVCGSAMLRNIFNYCPWCGAEMKGETDGLGRYDPAEAGTPG